MTMTFGTGGPNDFQYHRYRGQSRDGPGPQPRPAQPPGPGGPHPTFSIFMPMSAQPDPEKAAELLRSLPTVCEGLLKRVNRIVAADGGDEGWNCGICLEGNQDVVKALPCNHLYHTGCLEPWLTRKHTW